MKSENFFQYGKYLTHLISCTLNDAEPEAPFEGMDWEQLYSLACFQKATALIYPSIKKLPVPDEVMEKLTYSNHKMTAREARQEIESNKILSALKDEGIHFIKMKGIVIKNLYPMPSMRTQTDVDLIVKNEDRPRCEALMKNFGYEVLSKKDKTDEYVKDKFFYYEFHSSLNSAFSFSELFSEPFTKTKPSQNSLGVVFEDEYFYMHIVTHLYKHFVIEGCGIRPFCDLYVFEKTHPNLKMDFIRETLSRYDLGEFFESVFNLSKCFFQDKPYDENQKAVATFIFKCGDHGSNAIRQLTEADPNKKQALSFWSKLRFAMEIYFPPAKNLKYRYPVLEKAPVLLPFYWVKRAFHTIFFKKEALRDQKRRIDSVNSEEIKEAQKIYKMMGLSNNQR